MAGTVIHAQYNSPLPLYSQESAQEELERATGQHSPRPMNSPGRSNIPHQSGAYKMVHSNQQLPAEHSARMDEIRNNEYPHYKGYVDPNLQSPSFKRLQYSAGVADRESSPHRAAAARDWAPLVAQRDPAAPDAAPLDATWAEKVAQAERPHVPATIEPDWVARARGSGHRWHPVQPEPQPPVRQFSPVASMGTSAISQQQFRHFNEAGGMQFGYPQRSSPIRSRPRSLEPPNVAQQKEPWLKPYIAPNVLNAKFSGRQSGFYKSIPARPTSGLSHPGFGGTYYGPADGRHSPSRYVPTGNQPHFGTAAFSPSAPRSPVFGANAAHRDVYAPKPASPYMSDVRSFSPRPHAVAPPAVPPRQARAWSPPAAPLWQGETEAWQRRREMEEEIRRRTATSASGALGPPPGFNLFNDAAGSSTRSQTQGGYNDPQGGRVDWVREEYTSSGEPTGAQFSALNQREQRQAERPLDDGVVSRHVTSKTYKRSTYTTSTTTGVQSPPRPYNLPISQF